MIHIIDPALDASKRPGQPPRRWEMSLTDHQLRMAYLVAERQPDGRFKVIKGRFCRELPPQPVTQQVLTLMIANALSDAPLFQ